MIRFFRTPFGFAIYRAIVALINPVESIQNYSSWVTYFVIGLLINLVALLLYRLLIKQEPFSQGFRESASRYWATIYIIWITFYIVFFSYTMQYGLLMTLFAICMMGLFFWAFTYVITYFYLWLTDKIVNYLHKN